MKRVVIKKTISDKTALCCTSISGDATGVAIGVWKKNALSTACDATKMTNQIANEYCRDITPLFQIGLLCNQCIICPTFK